MAGDSAPDWNYVPAGFAEERGTRGWQERIHSFHFTVVMQSTLDVQDSRAEGAPNYTYAASRVRAAPKLLNHLRWSPPLVAATCDGPQLRIRMER